MTAWFFCLLLLIPAMRNVAMWRAWLALGAASIAGMAFPYPAAWVLIDLIAAAVVIFPPRAGFQKAIAGAFGVMMVFELGWLYSAQMNPQAVGFVCTVAGWFQLMALLTWGAHEHGGLVRILDWFGGPSLARLAVDDK